ncbi:MAG: citramalate synthase [Pseudomonadota bacterium]|nr:citramalate synthase [Pseudomonadota bacterium]
MAQKRLFLFDTTLRDGQQTQGVQFSVSDKLTIAGELDRLGIDYTEGGWPGANPTDDEFFSNVPVSNNSKMTAFGMTKRAGISAENDDLLSAVVNVGTSSVCLVGKTDEYHVKNALHISLEENKSNIEQSIRYLVAKGREAIFDAEHFFDGYKNNPDYALEALKAAYTAGARWVVLCDTNGGTLPHEIFEITSKVVEAGVPKDNIGIHAHNDTGNAIANSLAAINAGARQVQGTLNGLGERCGNANLITLIPTLVLKEPYSTDFCTNINKEGLRSLTRLSRLVDDILNRIPNRSSPYVGSSAFSHKGGLHASAVLKNPKTYEHISPDDVGNKRVIPVSNQAGKSSLLIRLSEANIQVDKNDPKLHEMLRQIKQREDEGYSYDLASASFELLAHRVLGSLPDYFEVKRYRVLMERRKNKYNKTVTLSEAVVVIKIGDKKVLSVSESMDPDGSDRGPVNALAKAIGKDVGPYQKLIDDIRLVDFKVRITSGGVGAVTRVLIDSEDSNGRRWSTVGLSANIIDASFQALLDAIYWKLLISGASVK